MKTLFIDTHMYDIDIILFDDYRVVKSGHIKGEKYNSTFLMPTLKNVCSGEEFDQIVIVNGPGSFTGVRLGVTIAKTLAYTMNKIIKPVSYFDLMNYSSNKNKHTFGIADGNGYFIANYNDHKLLQDPIYLSNLDYQKYIKENTIETNVVINYGKVLEALDKSEGVNPHSVKPIYVKLIGVEQ